MIDRPFFHTKDLLVQLTLTKIYLILYNFFASLVEMHRLYWNKVHQNRTIWLWSSRLDKRPDPAR